MEPEVADYIEGDDTLFEREPLERLAAEGQLMAYKHPDFWACMDTVRDKVMLEKLLGDGRRALEGVVVRVLVTGHDGYIGTILVPKYCR